VIRSLDFKVTEFLEMPSTLYVQLTRDLFAIVNPCFDGGVLAAGELYIETNM